MENQSKTIVPLEGTTISQQEAEERTTAWRSLVTDKVPGEDNNAMIPRAVYISMEDIKALYEKHSNDAIGVRAYFTYKQVPDEYIDPSGSSMPEISVLLVPVNYDNKDVLYTIAEGGEESSSIYDFTKPCPDMCDPTSPLYAPL